VVPEAGRALGRGGPDLRNYRVDCDQARRDLPSFQPRWTVRAGVEQLHEAFTRVRADPERCSRAHLIADPTRDELILDGDLDELGAPLVGGAGVTPVDATPSEVPVVRRQGLRPASSLGDLPLADAFAHGRPADRPEPRFPLDVAFCPAARWSRSSEEVPAEQLFVDNYLYFSSFSDHLLEHARTTPRSC
jgi:hypothetical protein